MTNREKELENGIKGAAAAFKDLAMNWDCDSDAHKYNTTCRCCMAADMLKRMEALLPVKNDVEWHED